MIDITMNSSDYTYADGNLASGTLTITPNAVWEYLEAGVIQTVTKRAVVYRVRNGKVADASGNPITFSLAPTSGAGHDVLNAAYEVIFNFGNRTWTEVWDLPASPTSVEIVDIAKLSTTATATTPVGAKGAAGSTVLNGTVDPTTEGVDGDFYYNTATNTMYGAKSLGVWGAGTSLIGATGAKGADSTVAGPQGATGIQGIQGAQGQSINHTTRTSGTGAAGTTDTYTVWGDVGETINLGTFTVYNGTNGVGSGDMLTATYDPTAVSGDAFAMDNMVEGTLTKVMTAAERSAIAANSAKVGITATQANAIVANSAKISYTDATAVALNTAKISADGSVNTHSDVNFTTPTNGQVVTFNSTSGKWENVTPVAGITDHTLMSNIGTQTHAQLEAAIALNTAKVTYPSADSTKLAGIAAGATVNSIDAVLLARANHTGTQLLATISDAGTAAAKNIPAAGDAAATQVVLGTDTRLTNSRTPSAHTQTASTITDFSTAVAANTAVSANTAKVTNAVHTGDVTGSGALTIATGAVTLAKMAAGTTGNLITYAPDGTAVAIATGAAGEVLTSGGAGVAPTFQAAASGGGGYTWQVKTGAYTTVDNDGVLADTTAGAFTNTLPPVGTAGQKVMFFDGADNGSWGTNNFTVAPDGVDTIKGVAGSFVADVNGGWAEFLDDGTTWQVRTSLSGSGVAAPLVFHVQDQKAAGSHGGAGVAGVNTRTLNTVLTNTITGASLAGNQVTLPQGTYDVTGSTSAFITNGAQSVLRNVTDSVDAIVGMSEYANGANTVASSLEGRLIITSPKVFNLQTYLQTAQPVYGLGASSSSGKAEIFSNLRIVKVA